MEKVVFIYDVILGQRAITVKDNNAEIIKKINNTQQLANYARMEKIRSMRTTNK